MCICVNFVSCTELDTFTYDIICYILLARFLYRKLQAHASGDPQTIFEDATSGKLRVKPGITFHLYITTAPCGDGALMSQR